MKRIDNDAFYEFIKQYDPDSEYHLVGEVDYHLLFVSNPDCLFPTSLVRIPFSNRHPNDQAVFFQVPKSIREHCICNSGQIFL